jgi:hypothetical protein
VPFGAAMAAVPPNKLRVSALAPMSWVESRVIECLRFLR